MIVRLIFHKTALKKPEPFLNEKQELHRLLKIPPWRISPKCIFMCVKVKKEIDLIWTLTVFYGLQKKEQIKKAETLKGEEKSTKDNEMFTSIKRTLFSASARNEVYSKILLQSFDDWNRRNCLLSDKSHAEMESPEIEELTLCGYCKKKFNETDQSPKLLSCKHYFCLQCMRTTLSKGTSELYCVYCWKKTELGELGPESLPTHNPVLCLTKNFSQLKLFSTNPTSGGSSEKATKVRGASRKFRNSTCAIFSGYIGKLPHARHAPRVMVHDVRIAGLQGVRDN